MGSKSPFESRHQGTSLSLWIMSGFRPHTALKQRTAQVVKERYINAVSASLGILSMTHPRGEKHIMARPSHQSCDCERVRATEFRVTSYVRFSEPRRLLVTIRKPLRLPVRLRALAHCF
jgi:hypothetical protein